MDVKGKILAIGLAVLFLSLMAYVTFFLIMNSKRLLGADLPRHATRHLESGHDGSLGGQRRRLGLDGMAQDSGGNSRGPSGIAWLCRACCDWALLDEAETARGNDSEEGR